MEQNLVQGCETKVVADACNASTTSPLIFITWDNLSSIISHLNHAQSRLNVPQIRQVMAQTDKQTE